MPLEPWYQRGNGPPRGAGRAFFQSGRIRHRPGAGQGGNRACGLHRPGAVLCPHLFHRGVDQSQRHGAAPPRRADGEHGPGAVVGDPVRGRQDPHPDCACIILAQAGPDAARFPGVADLIDAAGLGVGAGGAGGRVRRQRLGSVRRTGNAVDRPGAAAGRRRGA